MALEIGLSPFLLGWLHHLVGPSISPTRSLRVPEPTSHLSSPNGNEHFLFLIAQVNLRDHLRHLAAVIARVQSTHYLAKPVFSATNGPRNLLAWRGSSGQSYLKHMHWELEDYFPKGALSSETV